MATINDLYLKYTNKVGRTLESDRYFQYLYEMIQAGDNDFQQNYQIMHKVVDEHWLEVIEGCLDSINTIIEKPRRFIATKEEVVPVALARKITADSVRHLSMNTQFIASSANGDIQPTRVLNVSTEESYNLYENRFIYHLIQRLMTFIDKRTDIIFWITGDETQNVLTYQSKIDDAYEEIEYQIQMKIKNRQSFAENEAANMNVFMRIDRVRRMVLTFKNSAFCSIMSGCSKVRSPIQRTNLIMKDPDYRKCYQLWQFLESYDEVGYTIEVQNKALEFDEEYLIQMYTNLITNYTVFKSLIPDDSRKINENVLAKKKRIIKPKFIKKIKEEFVDDPNIEDVEIRQVFVKEVTQAQLEAEAALAEEIENRKKAEQALEDMDAQMISLQQQVSNLMMMNQEAEVKAEEEREAKEAALKQAEEEQQARVAAEESAAQAKEAAETTRRQADAEVADAKERIELARRQADAEIATAKQEAAEQVEAAQRQADAEVATAKQEAEAQVEAAQRQADAEVATAKQEAAEQVEAAQRQADAEVAAAKQEAAEQVEAIRRQTEDEIALTKEYADNEVQAAAQRVRETRQQAQDAVAEAQRQTAEAQQQLQDVQTQAQQQIQAARAEAQQQLQNVKDQADQQVQRALAETENLRRQTRELLQETQQKAETEIAALKQERQMVEAESDLARTELEKQVQNLQAELLAIQEKTEAKLQQALEAQRKAQEHAQALEQREAGLKLQLADANRSWEELEQRLQDTEKQMEEARAKALAAEEKAQANTLSHYIISALGGKKRRGGED